MGDSFGKLFKITTWGESHGPAIGVVIEGCPPLVSLDCKPTQVAGHPAFTCAQIQKELDRRRPGQTGITTPRKESDTVYILSGIFEGQTTGAPICALSWNLDVKSED